MATSQFKVYSSGDVDAPILNWSSGSLCNVLDAILVNGYGSKTSAGWSLEYTASYNSGSCYRPPSGSRMYLSVRDNNFETWGTGSCAIIGLEEATSFNTGSAQFPTSIQPTVPPSLYCPKVFTISSTNKIFPRTWIAFADAYTLYFFVKPDPVFGRYYGMFFGDFYSFASGDNYNCMIIGSLSPTNYVYTEHKMDWGCRVDEVITGHFSARTYTGTGESIAFGKHGTNSLGFGNPAIPLLYSVMAEANPENNSTYMSPIWISEYVTTNTGLIRGKMRGMYYYAGQNSATDGIQFSGSNEYSGKVFQIVKPTPGGVLVAIEVSDTVDTN